MRSGIRGFIHKGSGDEQKCKIEEFFGISIINAVSVWGIGYKYVIIDDWYDKYLDIVKDKVYTRSIFQHGYE